MGAAGRFGRGDAQWMTAGKGVQHSEMFPLFDTSASNPLELFQLWLNLPRKSKKVAPYFKMLWHEEIPVVTTDQGRVKIIAGEFANQRALPPPPASWAADPGNEVAVYIVAVRAGGSIGLPGAGAGINRSLYFFAGEKLAVNGREVDANTSLEMEPESSVKLEAIGGDAQVLLLQGKPIGEPVVQHGPFVVNEQEELRQVFIDYQATGFGGWPWASRAQVHDVERGRFALHADGTLELK
jgi:redox-sensitive bicupin YhaK (pirin superfamily)